MKKAISLLLALVLCLSLCACGSSDKTQTTESAAETVAQKEKVVCIGKWESGEGEVELIVNEDKTGELTYMGEVVPFTWVYDEATSMMIVIPENKDYNVLNFTYIEEDGSLYNDWYPCTRVE